MRRICPRMNRGIFPLHAFHYIDTINVGKSPPRERKPDSLFHRIHAGMLAFTMCDVMWIICAAPRQGLCRQTKATFAYGSLFLSTFQWLQFLRQSCNTIEYRIALPQMLERDPNPKSPFLNGPREPRLIYRCKKSRKKSSAERRYCAVQRIVILRSLVLSCDG